ncbi:MAG: anti-sigma factor [Nocardioides sp.]
MNDVHALSGAYAVDALDDIERAAFERHLTDCADCRAEVASLREAAGLMAEISPVEPSGQLREKVLAGIASTRPLPPETGTPPASFRERRTRRRRPLVALVAAAAAVVAVGAGVTVSQQPWNDSSTVEVSAADKVLAAPDARKSSVDFKDGSSATVVHSDSVGQSVIVTRDMAAPPEGMVFQLWYDQPGLGMVSAGVMPVKADQTVVLDGDAETATAVGITVEPEGGSTSPTGEPVALFDFGERA